MSTKRVKIASTLQFCEFFNKTFSSYKGIIFEQFVKDLLKSNFKKYPYLEGRAIGERMKQLNDQVLVKD